jgi:hypothetical protein
MQAQRGLGDFFCIYFIANLQSTPPGAISKCVRGTKSEGRSHPAMTLLLRRFKVPRFLDIGTIWW